MKPMAWGKRWLMAGLVGGATIALPAQSVLCVEKDGKAAVVRAVHNSHPMLLENGKLGSHSRGARAALVEAKEFLPYFVAVRDLEVKSSYLELHANGSSGDVNNQFEFRARFESPFALREVFFVLELEAEAGKYIFYYEVGELKPREPKRVAVFVPMGFKMGTGKFKLHLFSEGGELLHSEQPPLFRDRAVDRMVRRRIEGVKDAPLRPFVGPAPDYPRALLKKKVSGTASVRFRVMPNGAVLDPEIAAASAPEFGEAALAAVRLWRFLPAVKSGRPIEGRAELPFTFEPPAEEK